MRISLDFDGTIYTHSFPEVGVLFPKAKDVINRLFNDGHIIIINTCRSGRYQGMAQDCFKRDGIRYHWINNNDPDLIHAYGEDCRKISADLYIDNRQLGGLPKDKDGNVDWLSIERLIKKHKVLI